MKTNTSKASSLDIQEITCIFSGTTCFMTLFKRARHWPTFWWNCSN